MTPAQKDLLQRLIEADRLWRSKKEIGDYVDLTWRGVEVSSISGVDRRTAQSLVDAGLAEWVGISTTLSMIFLGKYLPFDELEEKDLSPGFKKKVK